MDSVDSEKLTWFDSLTRKLSASRDGIHIDSVSDIQARTVMVARTRWVLLVLIGFYAVFACGVYSSSSYGFFLSRTQFYLLIFSLLAVIFYNTVFQHHLFFDLVSSFRFRNRLQIFLDIIFVTVLIYLSGGASSWFWPVYLIVTIEAAFLLKKRRNVFISGAVGSILYGSLLLLEYHEVIPSVDMPFVNSVLNFEPLYLVLIWLWVTIVNATVAIISVFLMTVIRRENEEIRASEERLIGFIDTAGDLIYSNTPDGRLLYANRAWQRAVGYGAEEMPGLSIWDVVHPEASEQYREEVARLMRGEEVSGFGSELRSRDGNKILVEGSLTCSYRGDEVAAVWGICRDVTDRRQAEDQLLWLAHHDPVTELANRTLFNDRLKQARAMAKRSQLQIGILFLDLDRFKIINDTLGHLVGDVILREVGQRLLGCLRETDTVARIGGDEYTIILTEVRGVSDIERIARKILAAVMHPFHLDGHELHLTTSLGISIYPTDGEDLDRLVKKADIAMYHAKTMGRNNFQFYSAMMDENAARKLMLMNSLQKGLEREEFVIYYQPKFDIATGRITSLEALLRWKSPELGVVYPDDFVPIAEETGLIIPLGEWVLREACRQNKAWQEQGFPPVRVAVNLSPYQFKQRGLVETIESALAEAGLDAEHLEIEITESVIMQNPDMAVEILCEMRKKGVHISIDDFGTGYSSLAHLKKFSVNTLKIDKSFVRDVVGNPTDAAIATAIIAMGNSLNLSVIAEGVETEGQLAFLKKNRCNEVQGYLLSVPLPADMVPSLMVKEHRQFWN